jgi:Lrp/AsnC family transcriptional regulator for asnA, asnC and gidA
MYRALQKKTYTCSSNSVAILIRLRRINAQHFMYCFPKVATIARKRLFTSESLLEGKKMKEDQEKRKHNRYLDTLDRDIINELQDDGRRPYSEIASKLKVSEGTVRKRVKKLMDMDVFKIAGLIDPGKYGEHLLAIVGVQLGSQNLLENAQKFSELSGVLSVGIITGRYDLICQVLFDAPDGLINFFTEEVSKIKDVKSTETFIIYKAFNWKVNLRQYQ